MTIKAVYFTDFGASLAQKLNSCGIKTEATDGRGGAYRRFVKENFKTGEKILFIGAVGIAVRAIAPYINSKATDPAVVVMDDRGNFIIPILSGHLGGANETANMLAKILGATAVITTATDIGGVFAIDDWARKNGVSVLNIERIKSVSSKLLNDQNVLLTVDKGEVSHLPKDVLLGEPSEIYMGTDVKKARGKLHLVHKCCVLGVGCKKGTDVEAIETLFKKVCEDISEKAFFAVATIDIKKNEVGLLQFCERLKLPLYTFSGQELNEVSGEFSGSDFVKSITGVDNVCERSAKKLTDFIKMKKISLNGVTMAVGQKNIIVDFS